MSKVDAIVLAGRGGRHAEVAFSVERAGNGWRALVAITALADAMPRGSPTDSEALRRGFTRYHGEGGLGRPMLPRRLEAESGLDADHGRPPSVLAISFEFGADGEAAVASLGRARLTGPTTIDLIRADRLLGGEAQGSEARGLRAAADLGRALLAARRRRGALTVDVPDVDLATNEEGRLLPLPAGRRHRSARLLAELEIAADAALARRAAEAALPLLYRNQPAAPGAPPADRLRGDLETALRCGDLADARERIDAQLPGAVYASAPQGNYALALPAYAQATSPLHRYADLVNQRQVLAWVDGRPLPYGPDELDEIAARLIALERDGRRHAARFAERELRGREGRLDRLRHPPTAASARRPPADPPATGPTRELIVATAARFATEPGMVPRLAHRCLFRFAGDGWEPLREVALGWLAARPPLALTALGIELERRGIGPVEFDEQKRGSESARTHAAQARLARPPLRSGWCVAPKRGAACGLAALELLCGLAEVRVPTPGGALIRLCERERLDAARFEVRGVGSTRDRGHLCTARLELADRELRAESRAPSEKLARRAATGELYEQAIQALYASAPAPRPQRSHRTGVGGDEMPDRPCAWSEPLFASLGSPAEHIAPDRLGEDFAFLAEATRRWLANYPVGPLSLDRPAGAEKVAALARAYESGFLGGSAELPPPSVLVARIAEEVVFEDGGVSYELTDWGRRGIGLIFAAVRVQERHLPGGRQITTEDFACLLQSTLPLLQLPEGAEGIIEFHVDP